MIRPVHAALALALAVTLPVTAQEARKTALGAIEPVSGFTGKMSMTMPVDAPADMAITETIRFEPWQMLDEMFRDDLVFVMRGGPSDWSQTDAEGVTSGECSQQRPLSPTGRDQMRQFGALLLANDLRPGEIRLSEWCRSQHTYMALEEGMLIADRNAMKGLGVDTDAALNLDNPDGAEALREMVMGWDGGDGDGPLLIVSHFDTIEAATNFRVYEGEILLVDPKRDGRVIGYLRLASATPDSVRFHPSIVAATGGAQTQ